jgi:hypothetical protein
MGEKGEEAKERSGTRSSRCRTMDAGMKYKELAERRLNAARTAFEAAAVELRAAERGVQDAEKYVESLRSHCDKAKKQHDFNDIVLVEHAS